MNVSGVTKVTAPLEVNQSGAKALDVVGSVDISENINITGSTKNINFK